MKGQKIYTKALFKLLIGYSLFTGILALIFFFFLFLYLHKETITSPATHTVTISPTSSPNKFCGGIAGIACPTGYLCKLSGNYPDAGGQCIKTSHTPK